MKNTYYVYSVRYHEYINMYFQMTLEFPLNCSPRFLEFGDRERKITQNRRFDPSKISIQLIKKNLSYEAAEKLIEELSNKHDPHGYKVLN